MRPSFEIDPGELAPPSQRSGTGRHTLPDAPAPLLHRSTRFSLDGMADEFFDIGDAGAYEGGPALVEAEPALEELEAPQVRVVLRTPEMDARRARLARVVATVVGCFATVLALGVVRASASERRPWEVPGEGVEAPPVLGTTVARAAQLAKAPIVVVEAPPPLAQAEPAPRLPPSSAPERVKTRVVYPVAALAPAPIPTPVRVVEAKPVGALPSVANFAARAGEPARPAGRVPTAAFAPAR